MEIDIESVETLDSRPGGRPLGHVVLFRAKEVPEAGDGLIQGDQVWPILEVQQFFPRPHSRQGALNIGVLVPRSLPEPSKGPGLIEAATPFWHRLGALIQKAEKDDV